MGFLKRTVEAIGSMDSEGNLPQESEQSTGQPASEAEIKQVPSEVLEAVSAPGDTEVPDGWAQFLEQEDAEAPSELEINFYGKSFKDPSELEKFVNSHFTQKSQELSEYKRQVQQQYELERQELLRQRNELSEWKKRVEAHLGRGGDAESFYDDEASRVESSELAEIRREMEQMKRERELANTQRQIEGQLSDLESRFPLIQNPGLVSGEDVRRNAIAAVLASNNSISLEQAYVQEVQKQNSKLRNLKKTLLSSKVQAARENPTGSTTRGGSVPVPVSKNDYSNISGRDLKGRFEARTRDLLKQLPDDLDW